MQYPTSCSCCSPINTWHIDYFVHVSCWEINTVNIPLRYCSFLSRLQLQPNLLATLTSTYMHQITRIIKPNWKTTNFMGLFRFHVTNYSNTLIYGRQQIENKFSYNQTKFHRRFNIYLNGLRDFPCPPVWNFLISCFFPTLSSPFQIHASMFSLFFYCVG